MYVEDPAEAGHVIVVSCKGMAKSRLVVFSKLFWPEGGGAELATYILVKEVLSRYFNVTVVSGTREPLRDALKHCRYIYWSILESRYKPFEWLKLFLSDRALEKLISGANIVYIPSHTLLPLAIATKIIKPSIRVVLHLHNYQPLTFTSVVLAEKEPDVATDVVVELGEHGSLSRAILSGFGHYANYVNKLSLLYTDRVVCVSREQRKILTKWMPSVEGKTAVVYNPLPFVPNMEKRPSETPTILYTGGGSYVKGFHVAIEALINILARCNCRVYVTYGRSISKEQMLLLKVLSKRFNKKLISLGRIPYEELLNLHSKAWTMPFTSIYEEPLPYAVMESMAVGTIPIASRVGGVPEIVERTPAEKFLCKPGDVECFVEKVEEVASLTPEELVDVGLKLREETMRRFSVENAEKNLMKIITSLIEG